MEMYGNDQSIAIPKGNKLLHTQTGVTGKPNRSLVVTGTHTLSAANTDHHKTL